MFKYILFVLLTLNLYAAQPNYCNEDTLNGSIIAGVDGDTIKISTNKYDLVKIRLLGIDTPETNYNGKDQGPLAFEAKDRVIALLPIGSKVLVTSGPDKCDDYGRYLGYVIIPQGGNNSTNLNFQLLREGYAVPYQISPTYNKDIYPAAKYAYDNKLKFYAGGTEVPYEWRHKVSNRPFNFFTVDLGRNCYVKTGDYSKVPIPARYFVALETSIPNEYKRICP